MLHIILIRSNCVPHVLLFVLRCECRYSTEALLPTQSASLRQSGHLRRSSSVRISQKSRWVHCWQIGWRHYNWNSIILIYMFEVHIFMIFYTQQFCKYFMLYLQKPAMPPTTYCLCSQIQTQLNRLKIALFIYQMTVKAICVTPLPSIWFMKWVWRSIFCFVFHFGKDYDRNWLNLNDMSFWCRVT